LKIESYFQNIQETISSYAVVQLSNTMYEKRGTYEGFIRGELRFTDDSVLHFREFVDVGETEERLMYAYQYMSASKELVFRYDNTGHHRKLGLFTYPHHKHEGSEENVVPSAAPELGDVLREIELMTQLP